ncbi:MAG: DUF2141 domain-containing protein [Bacteroidota bacterium]
MIGKGILTLLVLSSFLLGYPKNQVLQIEVENISTPKGCVWFGIYNSEQSFLNKERAVAVFGEKITKAGMIQVRFDQMPFGTYAVAIFHDVNSNGELDQNLMGIPKEPYAFSKQPKSKWRVPTYEEVNFDFKRPNQSLKMRLENW